MSKKIIEMSKTVVFLYSGPEDVEGLQEYLGEHGHVSTHGKDLVMVELGDGVSTIPNGTYLMVHEAEGMITCVEKEPMTCLGLKESDPIEPGAEVDGNEGAVVE
jgi:hypothetical protein